jgi:hypothetical protein
VFTDVFFISFLSFLILSAVVSKAPGETSPGAFAGALVRARCYVLMILRPAGRFLTIPFPPRPLAARFLAAVIRPPLLFFAICNHFLSSIRYFPLKYLMPYGAGTVMVLDCTVTEPPPPPDPANNLPSTAAPLFTVMVTAASMFPLKMLVVPRVAELPTCQ